MDVSIIIVNYKTCKLVIDCIKSIYDYTKEIEFEIIVVDNNSEDGSVETISHLFSQIKVISLQNNIGFGKANNIGVKYALGDFIFFLNSDTVLLNDAISILYQYMVKHNNVGICGGQLYDREGNVTISYVEYPSFFYFLSLIINGDVHTKKIPIFSEGKVAYSISGADMMIRQSVIKQCGAFDPDFFMYYEDTELSYRVQKNGFEIHFVPDAKIKHLQGMSAKKKNSVVSVVDLSMIESRFLYLNKVKGLKNAKFFLGMYQVKLYISLFIYQLTHNSQKVEYWKTVQKTLPFIKRKLK